MQIDNNVAKNSAKHWKNRVMIFIPSTGLIRMEWAAARYGQIIPTNWSHIELHQWLSGYIPIDYQLADAQNLMAKRVVENDVQWVIYIEHDNVIPPNTFVKLNQYINDGKIPVISGLYFTKANPTEPILYRGRGNSYYGDWKMGDKVWVDGIPFGCRLENAGLIKAAWENSPEYLVGAETTRRVFDNPTESWYDQFKNGWVAKKGTTDLAWCDRCMEEGLFEKAGFPEFQKKKNPFMVDTTLFVKHIDQDGVTYPLQIPDRFLKKGEKSSDYMF